MELTGELLNLISLVRSEERHCFNAIHWKPTSVPCRIGDENATALDWYGKPITAEITSMMCSDFMLKWDSVFLECPEHRDRLKQLKPLRWTMLTRTAEFIQTADAEAFRHADAAAMAVSLLVHDLEHEAKLLRRADSARSEDDRNRGEELAVELAAQNSDGPTPEEKAIAILISDNELSVAAIAARLDVDRTTAYKWKKFMAIFNGLKRANASGSHIRRGSKADGIADTADHRTRTIDQHVESGDLDD